MSTEPSVDILIVDDRASQRQALGAVVENLGARVQEAGSGRDALRLLLEHEFAVILLDVDMPGMDGFETASIIRQRTRCEHTPIIFVTAYGDESHAARGYLLGAVDYIQSPVDTHVLRSKVAVFVELFRKTREATELAESRRRNAEQLRRMAELSLAVHDARSLDGLLDHVASAAAAILDVEQVAVETLMAPTAPFAVEPEEKVHHLIRKPAHRPFEVPPSADLFGTQRALRFGVAELEEDPNWSGLSNRTGAGGLRGWLAAPLRARAGHVAGAIHLTGKRSGDFDAEDENLLLQIAQIASIAIENTLFKDAAEANRLKDQFLATLSHELRTPLQAMLSWARILQEDASDPEIRARGIDVIKRSAVAQKQLIDDLLDVSRIVTGKLRLEPQVTSLETIAQSALDLARPTAEGRGVQLGALIDSSAGIQVYGDPHRLQQVIENLLSNAIKFTPKGGSVRLLLSEEAGRAEIRVVDSGEGIAPDFLPYVFERFRQADSTSTRSHTGLGIGLAIVRHLVELHGGRVHAESAGKGQGASFVVEVPLVTRGDVSAVDPSSNLSLTREPNAAASLRGLHILLVDDVDDARECVALLLRRRGAEVTSVASVNEALTALMRGEPDVLVSDIAMPGRDGISLIEELRGTRGSRIPAAALSAYARPEERERALRAGFDIHLSKPVREETLIANVVALARMANAQA